MQAYLSIRWAPECVHPPELWSFSSPCPQEFGASHSKIQTQRHWEPHSLNMKTLQGCSQVDGDTWSCCSSAALTSHCSCTAFNWFSWVSWRLCLSCFCLASSSDKNWEGKPVLLSIGLIYYMFCFFWIQTCVRRCRCSGPLRPSFLSSILNWFKWDFTSAFWAFWKHTLSWACNDFCSSSRACWNREALSLSYHMREQNHRRLSG